MAKAKRYTAEQLRDAEKMAATIANVPEEKRTLVIMMTNSFMAGMEAQKKPLTIQPKQQRWHKHTTE